MSAIRSADIVALHLALGNRWAAEVMRSANHLIGDLVPGSKRLGIPASHRLGNELTDLDRRVLSRPLPARNM